MVRQTLDADSPYVDVAQHGSGMTALQYRRDKNDNTQSTGLNIDAPKRVRLEKRGDTFTMFLSNHGEPLHQVGASIKLHFEGPFYVGIGLSGHNTKVPEKATFRSVELKETQQGGVIAISFHQRGQEFFGAQRARPRYPDTGPGTRPRRCWGQPR